MLPIYDENPTKRTAVVTIGLIVTCILVFIWEVTLPETNQEATLLGLAFTPATLLNHGGTQVPGLTWLPAPFTIITSLFMHSDLLHLVGNMLYLWIFGNNIEDILGRGRFLAFYLGCGVFAALVESIFTLNPALPMIGASGAVAGVLGAYMLRYPRAWVLIWAGWFAFWLPAVVVLGFWFVLQILSASAADVNTSVAWYAHIGGFVFGMILMWAVRPRTEKLVK